MHIRELDYFEKNKKCTKYNLSQIGLDSKIKEIYIKIPKMCFKNARIVDNTNSNILFSTFSILFLQDKSCFKINFSKTNQIEHHIDFEPFIDSNLIIIHENIDDNIIVEVLFEKIHSNLYDNSSLLSYCSIL
jgi:hypothetical protein